MTDFRNIFDTLEEDFDIDELTINEDLGIDPHAINSMVLDKINTQQLRRKKRKFLSTLLIAAVVSVALIGTTVIATQVFKPDFTEKFSGDVSSLVVYEPESFHFASLDDNLDAYFVGIVGDHDSAVASVLLTKKDETPFLADKQEVVLQPEGMLLDEIVHTEVWEEPDDYNYLAALRSMESRPDYDYVFYTKNRDNTIMSEDTVAVDLRLNEDCTELTLYINVNVTNGETDGGAADLSFDHFFTYKKLALLATFPDMEKDSLQKAEALCMQKDLDLEMNCHWEYENGVYHLYETEEVRYDLPFDMSFTMDFNMEEPVTTVISANNAPTLLRDDTSITMTLTPFQLNLTAKQMLTKEEVAAKITDYCRTHHYSEKVTQELLYWANHYTIQDPATLSVIQQKEDDPSAPNTTHIIESSRSYVTMKDGRIYYLVLGSFNISCFFEDNYTLDVNDDLVFYFSDKPIEDDEESGLLEEIKKTSVLNPQEVDTIRINGHIIYQRTANGLAADNPSVFDITRFRLIEGTKQDYTDFFNGAALALTQRDMLRDLQIEEDGDFGTEDGTYRMLRVTLTVSGTEKQLVELIRQLEKNQENDLVIDSIAVTKEKDDRECRTMRVTMTNYYPNHDLTLTQEQAADYISHLVDFVDDGAYLKQYFTKGSSPNIEPLFLSIDPPNYLPSLNAYEQEHRVFRSLSYEDAPHVFKDGYDFCMYITPYKIVLEAQANDPYDYLPAFIDPPEFDPLTSRILTKDGTEYYFIVFDQGSRFDGDKETHLWMLAYAALPYDNDLLENDNERQAVAVPFTVEDIDTITLNGDILYHCATP